MSSTMVFILTILLAILFLVAFIYSFVILFSSDKATKSGGKLNGWRQKVAGFFRHDKVRRA